MRKFFIGLLPVFLLFGCQKADVTFPSKPITIVVPWDAGGGTDQIARFIAKSASDVFGVNVNVLNQAGGAGTRGHIYGMNRKPDGYTVTMITYELCTYKPLGRAQIDTSNFKPIMQLNEDPGAITVHSNSPWQTLDDYIQYAKAHPGDITCGNSGPGAVWHLGAVKLENLAEIDLTHIPHDGAKPAVVRLLGEHIESVAVSPAEVLPNVQDGTLRCLGIMSEERFAQLPDVPTMKEQGIELVHGTWRGLAVPKDTPDEIVTILEKGFTQAYNQPQFQEAAKKALFGLKYRDSEGFAQFLNKENEEIAKLIEQLGLTQN